MKNSSRLLAEIDRKRSRSSSGWRGFSASSSTRSLKASQDSSRLKKRSGELASGCGRRGSRGFRARLWPPPGTRCSRRAGVGVDHGSSGVRRSGVVRMRARAGHPRPLGSLGAGVVGMWGGRTVVVAPPPGGRKTGAAGRHSKTSSARIVGSQDFPGQRAGDRPSQDVGRLVEPGDQRLGGGRRTLHAPNR